MNQLRPLLAAPPDRLFINEENVPQYYLPSLTAFLFFSNHPDALTLDPGDRRFPVYWSPATPRPPAFYREFHPWLRAHADAIFAWLLARDLSGSDAGTHAPMTADKAEVIDGSRSSLEQYVRALVEARAAPFQGDLVVLQRVLPVLVKGAVHGTVSLHGLGKVLRRLGGRELRQLRLQDRSRPRCWAVRRADTYAAMSEGDLTRAFNRQDVNRGRGLRLGKDDTTEEER
jgi:hypothetical protein